MSGKDPEEKKHILIPDHSILPGKSVVEIDTSKIDDIVERENATIFEGPVWICDEVTKAATIKLDPSFKGTPAGSFLFLGTNDCDGYIVVRDSNDLPSFIADGKEGGIIVSDKITIGYHGTDGDLWIHDREGYDTIHMDGETGNLTIRNKIGGTWQPVLNFFASYQNASWLSIGCNKNPGVLTLKGNGNSSIHLTSNKGRIEINNNAGDRVIELNTKGDLSIKHTIQGVSTEVFKFDASIAAMHIGNKGSGGDMLIRDKKGKATIQLKGDSGDIQLYGADCAEEFIISEQWDIEPGMVLVIESDQKLSPCQKPYDKRVAGVVSGANGNHPGIILGKNSVSNKKVPIALAGKVYCHVDAQYAPIDVGDLLTTSSTCGHAMRAEDSDQAFGAVIGKALHPINSGRGLIPILVALQ